MAIIYFALSVWISIMPTSTSPLEKRSSAKAFIKESTTHHFPSVFAWFIISLKTARTTHRKELNPACASIIYQHSSQEIVLGPLHKQEKRHGWHDWTKQVWS